MHSKSIQDYLKAILSLEETMEMVPTNYIAKSLSIKSSSVTEMVGKLEESDLVIRVKYKGVKLTESGRKAALMLIRKHRIWETFLVEKLGFGWDEVHPLAEQLEHIESQELTNRIEDYLGNPQFDPHGDPIPDRNGILPIIEIVKLSVTKPGSYKVVRILDDDKSLLDYLTRISIGISSSIEIIGSEEYDNSILIELNGVTKNISKKVAEKIGLQALL